MKIWGRNGHEIRQLWHEEGGARAYMGVAVSYFPNFFVLAGPNTLPNGNSTLHGIECSVIYILRVLKPLLGKWSCNPKSIMVKPAAEDAYNKRLQGLMQDFVYTEEVNTYFINKESGRNTLIWPGSLLSFWWSSCVERVKWSDYDIEKAKTD